MIRPARPDEHAPLTELSMRSKAHWGYSTEFIKDCEAELLLTPELIRERTIFVYECDGKAVAMGGLAFDGSVLEVCDMFVDPPFIGTGIGRALFRHLVKVAREMGHREIRIDADPNAQKFYERMGAELVGMTPSGSIAGREIPQLFLKL